MHRPGLPGSRKLLEGNRHKVSSLGSATVVFTIPPLARVGAGRRSTGSCENRMGTVLELPGVGRWTAEYVLLRGLGRIDVFPGDDVGARNNLARWLRLRKPLDYSRVMRITGQWRPYGGLIYFHLLLDGLERAGYLLPEPGKANLRRARAA